MKNATQKTDARTIETYPVAGAAYLPGDERSMLTHAVDTATGLPLCKRVKASNIIDDSLWEGGIESKPTCPICAKRDPRQH